MKNFNFKNDYRELLQREDIGVNRDDVSINYLGIMSAMFSKFLTKDPNKHIKLYNETEYLKEIRVTLNDYDDILGSTNFTENSLENFQLLKDKPHIITTFHYGLYLMTGLLLAKNKIEFSALISKGGLTFNSDQYKEVVFERYNYDLKFIDASKTNSVISMIKELKNGKTLLVFLDGNMGATEKIENLINVKFLNHSLNVRKGIAYLALKTKTPISTLINYIDNEGNVTFHIEKILDDLNFNSKTEKEIMQHQYDILSKFVELSPAQWESWYYVHRSLPNKKEKTNNFINTFNEIDLFAPRVVELGEKFYFNLKDYSFFIKNEESSYILVKENLNSYYISNEFGNILKKSVFNQLICDNNNINLVNHLYSKKLLIKIQ